MWKAFLYFSFAIVISATSGCGEKARVSPLPAPSKYVFVHPTAQYSVELPGKPDSKNMQAGGNEWVQYHCRIGMDAAFSTNVFSLDEETDLSNIEKCQELLQDRLNASLEPLQGKITAQNFRLLQDKYPIIEVDATIQIPSLGQAYLIYRVFLTKNHFVQLGIMGQEIDLQSSTAKECLRSVKVLERVQP